MKFYDPYDDKDDRLGKNDDWKNYKPCDDCGEPFLKSDLIYVTTNIDDPENMVETLRLCAECLTVINHYMMNEDLIEETNIKLEFFINIMIRTLIIGKIL